MLKMACLMCAAALLKFAPFSLLPSRSPCHTPAALQGMVNLITAMPVVSQERTVFYRERAASMYSAFPFAVASSSVELPYIVAQSIIYCPIVFFLVGFTNEGGWRFWYVCTWCHPGPNCMSLRCIVLHCSFLLSNDVGDLACAVAYKCHILRTTVFAPACKQMSVPCQQYCSLVLGVESVHAVLCDL